MKKSFAIGTLATTLFFSVFAYIVHGQLLESTYAISEAVYRPNEEMTALGWAFITGYLILAVGFTGIYGHLHKDGDIGNAIKYGAFAGLFLASFDLLNYVVFPTTLHESLIAGVANIVMTMMGGALLAVIYQKVK